MTAARAAWLAGQVDRTVALLDTVDSNLDDPVLQAERLHVRGLVELRCGALLDAGTIFLDGAHAVQSVDAHKALEILVDAGAVAGRSGNFARMAEVGHLAALHPDSHDELDALLRDLVIGVGGFIEGSGTTETPRIQSAIHRAQSSDDLRVLSWAAVGASTIGDEAAETELLNRAVKTARTSGSVEDVVLMLEVFVASEHVNGRFGFRAEADEGLRLARELALPNPAVTFLASLSWLAALEGDDDLCHAHADGVIDAADRGLANAYSIAQWALALLDMVRGNPAQTADRLATLRTAPLGQSHPFYVLFSTPELVEALVHLGRRDDAVAAFAPLDGYAQQPDAPVWSVALAARCNALLADGDEAERCYEAALTALSSVDRPFDLARTRLLYGQALRRDKRRAAARDQLRPAIDIFERLRAEPWAERARVELRATGEVARKRDVTTSTQLTPQELQIARLVSEGNSNKNVATQLFISPKTVEYHLAKVFSKLNITSRAELIRNNRVLEQVG